VCLLVIAGKNIGLVSTATAADIDRPAFATVPLNEDGSMNVRVVELPDVMNVNIWSCENEALREAGPIEVKVKNWP
jgi:hypothetical protein